VASDNSTSVLSAQTKDLRKRAFSGYRLQVNFVGKLDVKRQMNAHEKQEHPKQAQPKKNQSNRLVISLCKSQSEAILPVAGATRSNNSSAHWKGPL
jgi:hypothetical protein